MRDELERQAAQAAWDCGYRWGKLRDESCRDDFACWMQFAQTHSIPADQRKRLQQIFWRWYEYGFYGRPSPAERSDPRLLAPRYKRWIDPRDYEDVAIREVYALRRGMPLEREVRLTEYMPLREAKKRAIAFLSRITSLQDQQEWDERIRQALLKKYGLANPRRNAEQIGLFEQAPSGEAIELGDGRWVELRFVGTIDRINEWEALLWGHDRETGLPLRLKIVQEKPKSSRYAVVWHLSTPPRGVFDLPLKQDVVVSGYVPLREAKKRAVEILSKIHTRQQEQEFEERLRQYISRLYGGKNPRLPDVTDRALRYRANRAIAQREIRCIYCGRPDGWLEVDHINGYEEDNSPENLAWACRACNTQKGAVFARAGIGRRTRQFNPRARKRAARATRGAGTLAEWMDAVMALKGYPSRFTLQEAIQKVRATPPEDRSAFAHEIWRRRRARGTDRRVPF